MSGKGITFDLLAQLRALALQTVGTEEGAAITNGPVRRCKAVLTVTVVESGGVLTAYLEQSSDNVTFYKVPGSDFKDESDGADIDAVGQYEIYADIEQRYARVVGVVAGDDITWACDLGVIVP